MNISSKAVLVNLAIPTAAMTRTQKDVTRDVLHNKHAKSTVGRFVKNLLPAARAATVQSKLNELRGWHYLRTTTWDDCGNRLLAAAAYFDYMEEYGKRKAEVERIVYDQLVAPWDDVIAEARAEQGELFDINMMPGPQEIQNRLVPKLVVLPVPQSGHLMVDLPEQMLAEARAQLEQDVDARFKASMDDVWERVNNALERVVDRLGTPDAIFRDSLIENVRELAELLPTFNITDDPRLGRIAQALQIKIACHSPGQLRNSVTLRATVANEAAAILADARGESLPEVGRVNAGVLAGAVV